jgi:hypothetical protein
MASRPISPEQVLQVIKAFSEDDLRRFWELLRNDKDNPIHQAMSQMGELITGLSEALGAATQIMRQSQLQERYAWAEQVKELWERIEASKAKPRFRERDAEIVRLRDECKLTWGQTLRRIKQDPRWAVNQNDEPLSLDTVKQAYRRFKSQRPEGYCDCCGGKGWLDEGEFEALRNIETNPFVPRKT